MEWGITVRRDSECSAILHEEARHKARALRSEGRAFARMKIWDRGTQRQMGYVFARGIVAAQTPLLEPSAKARRSIAGFFGVLKHSSPC